MDLRKNQVLRDALDLPPDERADLVERILSSFEAPDRKRIDELWAKEAEDRIDAYDEGRIRSIPAPQVFDQIEKPPDP